MAGAPAESGDHGKYFAGDFIPFSNMHIYANNPPPISSILKPEFFSPERVSTLVALNLALVAESSISRLMKTFCQGLAQLADNAMAGLTLSHLDSAAVGAPDPSLALSAGHGLPAGVIAALAEVDWRAEVADMVLNSGAPFRLGGTEDDAGRRAAAFAAGLPAGHPPVGDLLGVPLRWRDGGHGVAYLARPPGAPPFDAAEEALALLAATQFGFAYANAAWREAARWRDLTHQMTVPTGRRPPEPPLAGELREAIAAGDLVLYFQPKIALPSGHIAAAEALVRWRHPARGLVPPGVFVPIAEEHGLIDAIGVWVIEAACRQQAAWLAEGVDIVPVAVNVSAAHLHQGTVAAAVSAALAFHRLPATALEIEVTETALMADTTAAVRALENLRAIGVRLALDDFGTGYSSLAYLKRFPLDTVKIDRAFIQDIVASPEDATIATAIIAMAHRLNLTVVAEGVEFAEQLDFLRMHDCDQIQGYLFSPPVPAETFSGFLRTGRRLGQPAGDDAGHDGKGRPTVLLVDDEPMVLQGLTRMLHRDGYRILTATSGRDALAVLARQPVQVMVSDQRMPGMSGVELMKAVRTMHPRTTRIILSGYSDMAAVLDAVNHGAVFKFLVKPCPEDMLRTLIRDAVRLHAAGPTEGAAP